MAKVFAGSQFEKQGVCPTPSGASDWGGTKNGIAITDGKKGAAWGDGSESINEVSTVSLEGSPTESKLNSDFSGSGIVASPSNKKVNSSW